MVPVLILAVIAAGVIKSLMWVVARDEGGALTPATYDFTPAQTYDPTMPPRARHDDDVRAFLLPAVPEPGAVEEPADSQPGRFDRSR